MWQNIPNSLGTAIFSRRAFIVLIGKMLVLIIILARLLVLQIFKKKEYKTLSASQLYKEIPGKRYEVA